MPLVTIFAAGTTTDMEAVAAGIASLPNELSHKVLTGLEGLLVHAVAHDCTWGTQSL